MNSAANRHHEYQIYYGGFKVKIPNLYYCKECDEITTQMSEKQWKHHKTPHLTRVIYKKWITNVRSHKK